MPDYKLLVLSPEICHFNGTRCQPSSSRFLSRDEPFQGSRSFMSDSLPPHGLQHARLPCPPLSPGASSNSCPSSWWCHPTISSSVISSFWLQSFPESGSFPMSQFFTPGGKSIGFSISPSNEYSGLICFRIHWFDVLAVQGTLKNLLQHHNSKVSILQCSAFLMVQFSHLYMTIGKKHSLIVRTFQQSHVSAV